MTGKELERLQFLEKEIKNLAEKEFGLQTGDIVFEVAPAQKMMEGLAYNFPTNFSHWSFGRDYEKFRTIYDHSGTGIPYEVVWNMEPFKALLVETNPFALNLVVIAHVYGHVDFFLRNIYFQKARAETDIAAENLSAIERFRDHEARWGTEEVEKTIDAGMSIRWHQHPNPLLEEPDEDKSREQLIELEKEKLREADNLYSELKRPETKKEIEEIEKHLRDISKRTPPQPVYDLLKYITKHSPRPLKPWQVDVLAVVRDQARYLTPVRRTKMLNEGWAAYWHARIFRRLFEEKLVSPEEHEIFSYFHSAVAAETKTSLNPYRIGMALFEYIKECWDKGRFGREFDECEDPVKKSRWDTKANLGTEKIFEVSAYFSDRMAVETFFTDEFIKWMQIYIWEEKIDPRTKDIIYVIAESKPDIIKTVLRQSFSLYGIPTIKIKNANYLDHRELYLMHEFTGQELDERYRQGTMEKIYYLWGRKVSLETVIKKKEIICSFDGRNHKILD